MCLLECSASTGCCLPLAIEFSFGVLACSVLEGSLQSNSTEGQLMECISAVDDIKINKGHLCRCVVRQEVIIFRMSILFLAPDPMEVAK